MSGDETLITHSLTENVHSLTHFTQSSLTHSLTLVTPTPCYTGGWGNPQSMKIYIENELGVTLIVTVKILSMFMLTCMQVCTGAHMNNVHKVVGSAAHES